MTIDVPALPFSLHASHEQMWRVDRDGTVGVDAPAHTDFYLNPGGEDAADAESLLNAVTLLGVPPASDFQLSARVTVDFGAQYDAGVLMLWIDQRLWSKFCFEFSPDAEPMVVSVVTRDVSDDANAFIVADGSVWLRISRVDRVYAYHASIDGKPWRLVRVFTLGDDLSSHRVGFEAQSPTGNGCRVTFTDITFTTHRLTELRDGS